MQKSYSQEIIVQFSKRSEENVSWAIYAKDRIETGRV